MNLTDETLMAYADGELRGEELRAVETALKARPDLQAFVDRQRALRDHVEAAFQPLLGEEVPQFLLDAVARAPVSAQWQAKQGLRKAGGVFSGRRLLLWSGLPAAAALACGVILGIAIAPEGVFRMDGQTGGVVAQGALGKALDRQLASTQDPNAPVRVGLTFQSKDGRYCRTFESVGHASSLTGVACRDANGWAVATLASTPADSSAYRMAAGMPDAIRSTVERMISGEPLDANAERRARDAHWAAR